MNERLRSVCESRKKEFMKKEKTGMAHTHAYAIKVEFLVRIAYVTWCCFSFGCWPKSKKIWAHCGCGCCNTLAF